MSKRRARGEGTIYEDKLRNRWVGAVTINDRRRKVIGKTRAEARTRLNRLLRERDLDIPVTDGNLTLGDLLELWRVREATTQQLAPSTLAGYDWAVGHIRLALGPRRVAKLTPLIVEAAYDQWSADGLSRSSLQKLRSVLLRALDFGVRRELLARNPASHAYLPKDLAGPTARQSLTLEELQRFIEALDGERLGAMFAISVTMGLRPGEASGLLWESVDFEANTITVRTARRMDGTKPVIVHSLKTPKSHRTLSMPQDVASLLSAHQASQSEERQNTSSWADPALVFASRAGTPLSPSNVRRELARILRTAELPPIAPNELRHSAASILSDQGVALEQIADVLGHTSTRMLDATYRHRIRPAIGAAAASFDELLKAEHR